MVWKKTPQLDGAEIDPTEYVEENALFVSSSVDVPCSFTLGAKRFQ